MANCKDCKHSVFDEVWGEYKCEVRLTRIYDITEKAKCKDYSKDQSKTTESN